ncbi:asparagine--tRNA ligase [Alistipes sp.]|uniref:asparagine--tRNA ligase n=2 Tax=Alistipes TaxID=239759 RepID=UPI0011C8660F|nr:asparagine--tRNA ligase [Alistipes sp.]MBS6099758.1 asparagine--tRNA ligase [Alistipes sp.]HJI19375.1 asparagine--tRNA ligase [Rikenellaceae bacterium]
MKSMRIAQLLRMPADGAEAVVKGWVRTKRGNKNVAFIAVNDGSCVANIQVVVDPAAIDEQTMRQVTTGACIRAEGRLVASPGSGQGVELQASSIGIYGPADPESYPLQKKGHSLEFLREKAYLRPRTNTFGAILRIRHAMAYAIHKYFNDKGFYYLHTPLITGSDCEGAGAMFAVTTLDLNNVPKTPEGKVDYAQDFFGKACNLTVSGQLEGELGALSLGQIYTFGPTFRAENSNTPRHLSEFWMIEPEMAFYELEDNMELAEDFLKYLIRYALENCREDLEFMNKMWDEGLIERLNFVLEHDFKRLDYTEGVEILKASGRKFEFPCDWGCDLQSEHERYLVEEHFKRPVILINYPKQIKAFYMKQNEDGKTVRAMDVLFPKIGEIIGGSEREADYGKLRARVGELGMNEKDIWWYLDTRRWGSAPHSGFGLGFERLLLFVTGMGNIRDVIPFPRTPKNAEF